MGKGEIANFEQFHLFPQCFPKAFFLKVLKWVYVEERAQPLSYSLDLITLREKRFENIVVNPLPDDKILDWSKLKQIADDI